MKLVRYGSPGAEKPGLVDANGAIRDLSGHVGDIDGSTLSPDSLAALSAIDPASLPAVEAGIRLGCPVGSVGKLLCIGLNYTDHAKESLIATSPLACVPAVTVLMIGLLVRSSVSAIKDSISAAGDRFFPDTGAGYSHSI